jgi:hypothetical protein
MKSSKPRSNSVIADSSLLNFLPCMADSQKSCHSFIRAYQIKEPLNSPTIANAYKILPVQYGFSWTQEFLVPCD